MSGKYEEPVLKYLECSTMDEGLASVNFDSTI
jgi:hypothetical protein